MSLKHKLVLTKDLFEYLQKHSSEMDGWSEIMQHTDLVDLIFENQLEELKEDALNPHSILFQYLKAKGGKRPQNIIDVKAHSVELETEPYLTYLHSDEQEVENIARYGILTLEESRLLQNPYKLRKFFKSFLKDEEVIIGNKRGWKALLHNRIIPMNAIVVVDAYLFDDKEDRNHKACRNLVNMLDALLPEESKVQIQVLFSTKNRMQNNSKHLYFHTNYYQRIFNYLVENIQKLRSYPIAIELAVSEKMNHSRKIFTNYYTITCDKGFSLFDGRRTYKVLNHNDFRMEPHFLNSNQFYGDIQFKELEKLHTQLRKHYLNLQPSIEAFGQNDKFKYFTTNATDKYPFNRLLKL